MNTVYVIRQVNSHGIANNFKTLMYGDYILGVS